VADLVFALVISHFAPSSASRENENSNMRVTKRDGRVEGAQVDTGTSRIKKLCDGLLYVDAVIVDQKVCSGEGAEGAEGAEGSLNIVNGSQQA